MSDNSSSNMPMLGHRRWLLNPLVNMQIGFGEAVANAAADTSLQKFLTAAVVGTRLMWTISMWPGRQAETFPPS